MVSQAELTPSFAGLYYTGREEKMAGPAFDPNGAVRFDLSRGAASDARGARLLVLPAAALESVERTHAPAIAALGMELGRSCGARVAARLGGDGGVRGAQLEVVVSHLAGELAVAGIGAVHVERWGRAMVCVVTNTSSAAFPSDAFLAAVLGGALGAASGRDVAAAPLGKDGNAVRFFVGTKATADRVRGLVAQGKGFAQIVTSLQQTGGA
jgi:hypothetical protein